MIDRDSKRVRIRRVNDGNGHFDDMIENDPDGPFVEFDDYDKVCDALELLDTKIAPKEKSIYDMKLHDMIGYDMTVDGVPDGDKKDDLAITRVPGGWVYVAGVDRSACFVPYSEEFQQENLNA